MFWNAFLFPPDLADAFAAVYHRVVPESPSFRGEASGVEAYSAFFAKTKDGISDAGSFSEPEQWRFDWERSYTRDEWLDGCRQRADSTCARRKRWRTCLKVCRDAIDSLGGTFTMGYAAVVRVGAARSDAD